MNIYKIIFSFNEVLSCMQVHYPPPFDGDLHYESKGNYLLKAYVRATSDEQARDIAHELTESFNAVM